MRILLSNDDGYTAPGLCSLYDALRATHEVTIVAPDRNRSGASNSLTLRSPVRAEARGEHCFCVDGTPTDCVHLALTGLLDEVPDMVISGINAGRNLGDDTLYSGTVGAALEGRHLGCASLAVSNISMTPRHYETAVRVTVELVEQLAKQPLPGGTILNVNVPDAPYAELRGLAVTRLGRRYQAEPAVRATDPHGRSIWWIGAVGASEDCGPGTDFHAIAQGQVSVTPLGGDLTRHEVLGDVQRWMAAR
ncbi:MAG TPA: 5'/3'-nucleotidase SurE [Nevskiaceae bacterium]|nr:5'/3'-nucleotidase SurE [Nevskiaceae bacterium]